MPLPTFDAHKNLVIGSVVTPPSPATTGTTLTLQSGEGAQFPTAPYNVTICPPNVLPTASIAEVARVTARTGDQLTLTRAQEGSTARAIAVGDLVWLSVTSKNLQDIEAAFTGVARTDLSNTFTVADQYIAGPSWARWILRDTSQPADQRNFHIMNYGQTLSFQALDDALSGLGLAPMSLSRSGNLSIGGTFTEYGRATAQGVWVSIGYVDTNFTGNVGSWGVDAGDQIILRYMLIGKTLWLAFQLQTTTVSGSPSQLRIKLPLALSAAFTTWSSFWWFDAGVWTVGAATASGANLLLQKDPGAGAVWVTTTNGTWVYGTVPIPVN